MTAEPSGAAPSTCRCGTVYTCRVCGVPLTARLDADGKFDWWQGPDGKVTAPFPGLPEDPYGTLAALGAQMLDRKTPTPPGIAEAYASLKVSLEMYGTVHVHSQVSCPCWMRALPAHVWPDVPRP